MANLEVLDIEKFIKVKDSWLGKDGLELHYFYRGEEHFQSLTPEGAAQLFEQHGLIWETWNLDETIMVKWITGYSDECDDETGNAHITTTASWERFTEQFTFSQMDAIKVAASIEDAKQRRAKMMAAYEDGVKWGEQYAANYKSKILS